MSVAGSRPPGRSDTPVRVMDWMREHGEAMLEMLARFVEIESPSREPDSQDAMFAALATELEALGFRTRRLAGRDTGGSLYARPSSRKRAPLSSQLMLGHCDTVWPVGTLRDRPVLREGDRLRGPGAYDMKGGLVQAIFALRALDELDLEPLLTPLVFVNADEEIGSRESRGHILRLARVVDRTFVMEPSLGLEGRLKTARKGVGRFTITVKGRAAHAGLDPGSGVSAILELSHVIQQLFRLNDAERGVSVNVGTIDGGLGPNVVAPESRAVVDVRVPTADDAARVTEAIRGLRPEHAEAELMIDGAIGRPPMDPTPGNRALWKTALALAESLGIPLEEGMAGGGSDGNFTSQHGPTLDGLGAVGDGAHAPHEFVFIERLPERAALLALLLLAPRIREATP